MNKNLIIGSGVALFIVGIIAGYLYGSGRGYKVGYDKAIGDAKATQEALGKKAAEDAASAANPFQTVNPLEGVDADPLSKVKNALNPFK